MNYITEGQLITAAKTLVNGEKARIRKLMDLQIEIAKQHAGIVQIDGDTDHIENYTVTMDEVPNLMDLIDEI